MPTYHLGGTITVDIGLDVIFEGSLEGLSFNASWNDLRVKVGPVFQEGFDSPLNAVSLLSRTFEVSGFNAEAGETFILQPALDAVDHTVFTDEDSPTDVDLFDNDLSDPEASLVIENLDLGETDGLVVALRDRKVRGGSGGRCDPGQHRQ